MYNNIYGLMLSVLKEKERQTVFVLMELEQKTMYEWKDSHRAIHPSIYPPTHPSIYLPTHPS